MGAGLIQSAGTWLGTTYTPIVPNDVLTAEKAIVEQLKLFIDRVEVRGFPAQWEEYEAKMQKGSVLVRYDGSTYAGPESADVIVQWRRMTWEVLILVRDLSQVFGGKGNQGVGAYGLIEQIRQALTGFVLTGFKPAWPTRDFFRAYREGYWVYSSEYAFETLAIQNWADPSLPTLVRVTVDEVGGVTDTAVGTAPITFSLGKIVLGNQNVSAVVVSNTSTGNVYLLGTDYSLDMVNGIITTIVGGGITSGQTVNVSYVYADIVTAVASGGTTPTWPTN